MRKTIITLILLMLATPAIAQDMAVAVFDDADTDRDGKITRAEFGAARERNFSEKMDRNKDGAVARDDFGFLLSVAPSRGKRLDAFIAGADTNHDSRVTLAELRASPMRAFDRADTNRDAIVDKAELATLRQRAGHE